MGELLGQVWALQAGDQVFEGLDLRAVARWPKDSGPEVDVVVYHAGPVLRGIVEARNERVSVLAGYQRDQGAIEIGGGRVVADSIELDRASPDRPFEFQLSGRDAATQVVLSLAYASVLASDLVEEIRQTASLAGDIRLGSDIEYSRYNVSGGFSGILEDIARDTGSAWEVDGETLRMWPANEPRRETADVWAPSTGLMRVSGAGNEIRARAMLRPALRPGDAIRIEDEGYSGTLRLVDVTHEIDSYGGTWTTSIVGRPR
jgi:hypothetical protein